MKLGAGRVCSKGQTFSTDAAHACLLWLLSDSKFVLPTTERHEANARVSVRREKIKETSTRIGRQ
jgi:hypothetical protein